MIDELLNFGGQQALIPVLAAVVGTWLVRGLFGIHRSKSQNRKEFLELWAHGQLQDDIWLEVSVRHLFGTYLPASLIRSLLQSPQAARALLEVSESWDFLDMDDETKEVKWKKERYSDPNKRNWSRRLFSWSYFVCMGLALFIGYLMLATSLGPAYSAVGWVYVFFFAGLAFWCLSKSDGLNTANIAVPRWLGLQ